MEGDVEARRLLLEPREVLLVVGRVGDRQVAVLAELVGEEVVQDAPVLLGEDAVLGAVVGDLRDVVGEDPLQERLRIGAGGLDLAHVADVEDPRVAADVEVLLLDRCVLHRHLPAGEGHQLRPGRDMPVVQRGALERFCVGRHGARTLARPAAREGVQPSRDEASGGNHAAAVRSGRRTGAAGTYDVVACNAPGANGVNNSWTAYADAFPTSRRKPDAVRLPDELLPRTVSWPPRQRQNNDANYLVGGTFNFTAPPGTTIVAVRATRYDHGRSSRRRPEHARPDGGRGTSAAGRVRLAGRRWTSARSSASPSARPLHDRRAGGRLGHRARSVSRRPLR